MARRYTLETKIHALNQLETYDGDTLRVSEDLSIPTSTLSDWRKDESNLRQAYQTRIRKSVTRLKQDLQVKMLDRGLAIVERMDNNTLDQAPLNQLASALGALVNHALKLEEAIEETHEQQEKIVQFRFVSGDHVTHTPPWTMDDPEASSAFQSGGMRSEVGQDGTGENHSHSQREILRDARVVARPDLSDVESGLAGTQDDYAERDWYHD